MWERLSGLTIEKERKEEYPIYQQIADGLVALIERGLLPVGSRLPTVRELSQQCDVTRVTVQHAYKLLQERGWIQSTVGRGTFVSMSRSSVEASVELVSSRMTPDRVMADLSVLKGRPDVISLAMAEPDARLSPAQDFVRLFRGLEERAEDFLSYGAYQGDLGLRQMLSGLLAERGLKSDAEDIIITTGVTQGLSLVLAALCERGDRVLVEQPTYLGFLSALRSYGLVPVSVPLDEEGPCLEAMRQALLQERPRVFYTMPCFQNPSGQSISPARRAAILAMAREFRLTIIEDDIYGQLHYDGPALRPLKADDHEDLVVYVNSFSKSLFPGLRVGYIVPPAGLKERLMMLVRCRELCGVSLLQVALTAFLRRGAWHEHLRKVLPKYRARRDVLLDSLQREMPEEARWSRPAGGFCCWMQLPEQVDLDEFYRECLTRGVAFTPGSVFFSHASSGAFPLEASTQHLRLCFSTPQESEIQAAIHTMGQTLKDLMKRPSFGLSSHFELSPVV